MAFFFLHFAPYQQISFGYPLEKCLSQGSVYYRQSHQQLSPDSTGLLISMTCFCIFQVTVLFFWLPATLLFWFTLSALFGITGCILSEKPIKTQCTVPHFQQFSLILLAAEEMVPVQTTDYLE